MSRYRFSLIAMLASAGTFAFACGEDDPEQATTSCAQGAPASCTCDDGRTGTPVCSGDQVTCSCQNQVQTSDGGDNTGGSENPDPGTGGGSDSGAQGGGSTGGDNTDAGGNNAGGDPTDGGNSGGSGPSTPATGPKDGDPSKPVVTVQGVQCRQPGGGGGALGGLGAAISQPNAMVGGRELIVDYPCGKHEGAHMTVILNLHGTLIAGAPWQYQRGYFSAYRFVDSHNLIVVHPRSASMAAAGAQWGNMDGGTDLPHLLEVIDWVYSAFSKFQIRGLWIAGHSWGAMYATGGRFGGGFVCNEMLRDKVKGAIGMSGAGVPPCADRVSLISTRGETENIPLLDHSAAAMRHGCMTPMKGPEKVGNNERRYFDGCSPGWVHEDYNMLGKGHIDFMDAEVVERIVESIKSTER